MESEESDGENGIMMILCRLTRLSKNHFAIELLDLFIEFKAPRCSFATMSRTKLNESAGSFSAEGSSRIKLAFQIFLAFAEGFVDQKYKALRGVVRSVNFTFFSHNPLRELSCFSRLVWLGCIRALSFSHLF